MVKMHLTLAIHLLHWPSSPIHTRPNILFKLRCTSLHPQVPILPLCWSSSCPNILFKLHCVGHHTFIVATFTIGQNWIAGLQQCILNLNCAKKIGPSDCFDIYDSKPEFELDPEQKSFHIVLWGEHRNRKEFHEMLSQCFQLDSYKAPVKCECIL